MKHLLITLLILLAPVAARAGGQIMEIGVSGMVCEYCSAKVEDELKALPGVKEVKVDLEGERARIVMAEGHQADEATVRRLINEAGFTPGKIISH